MLHNAHLADSCLDNLLAQAPFIFNSRLVQVHEIWESSRRRALSDEASSCLIDGERKALVALPSLTGRSVAMEVYLVAGKRGKLRMSLSNSSN